MQPAPSVSVSNYDAQGPEYDSPQWGGTNVIRGTRIPKSPRVRTTITMPNPAANATTEPIPKKARFAYLLGKISPLLQVRGARHPPHPICQ
jgi:hypothetical protein